MTDVTSTCYSCAYDIEATGGVSVGGSADVTLERLTSGGGVVVGGSALVSMPGDVYDGYHAVYMLDGDADDRTRHQRDGTIIADAETVQGRGCAGALRFDSSGVVLPSLDSQSWSASMLCTIHDGLGQQTLYRLGSVEVATSYLQHLIIRIITADGPVESYSDDQLRIGWPHHIGMTWDGSVATVYLDGVETASVEAVPTDSSAHRLAFGDGAYAAATMQELRIDSRTHDAAWFAAESSMWCGGLVDVYDDISDLIDLVDPPPAND